MPKLALGILLLCSVFFLAEGCALSPQITNTPRSTIEQELLVSSLERGFETLAGRNHRRDVDQLGFHASSPSSVCGIGRVVSSSRAVSASSFRTWTRIGPMAALKPAPIAPQPKRF